jgi:four helix bundle protein
MEDELKKLEVYRIAHDLAVRIHAMTLALPAIERYEEAPQIRRSSKRASANIVEGHTQRKYKAQYLLYLYRALGSSDESQEHLLLLRETGSLADAKTFRTLLAGCEKLSKKLFSLIQSVEQRYETPNYLKGLPLQDFEPPQEDLESLP